MLKNQSVSYSHNMSGTIKLSSILGYRNYSVNYKLGFSSTFINYGTGDPNFNISFDSNWIAYSGKYYWWRILGCSLGSGKFTPESETFLPMRSKTPVISESDSDLISIQALNSQDLITHRVSKRHISLHQYHSKVPNCGPDNLQLLTAVVARDLEEVCTILKSPKFGPPIDFQVLSIKRYKKPITGKGIDSELIDQEFCNIPECLDLCVDLDFALETSRSEGKGPYRPYIFEMTVVLNIYTVESNIVLNLSGSAQILYYWYQSEGQANLSGSASFLSSSFSYLSIGNLHISNQIDFVINPLIRSSYGGLNLGGIISDFISPKYQYNFTNALNLQSNFLAVWQNSHNSYAFIEIEGQAQTSIVYSYSYQSQGGIGVASYQNVTSSYFDYSTNGSIQISGLSSVVSPYRFYQSQGLIGVSGSPRQIGRCLELSNNQITIEGSSEVYYIQAFDFTGSIDLGGIASDVVSPFYSFESTGESIFLGGNFDRNFTSFGLLVATAIFDAEYSNANIDSALVEDNFSNLSVVNGSVTTCGCIDAGLKITVNNNLSNTGMLSDFLLNNSLTIDSNLVLNYRKNTNSWFASENLRGISEDNQEAFWQLLLELACTNIIDGQTFDDYYLRFTFIARYQKGNSSKYQTKFTVNINSKDICANNAALSTNIVFDVNNESVLVDDMDTTYLLNDGIGMFSNDYWGKKLDYSALRASCQKVSKAKYVEKTPDSKKPKVTGIFPYFRINYNPTTPEYCTTALANPTQNNL